MMGSKVTEVKEEVNQRLGDQSKSNRWFRWI